MNHYEQRYGTFSENYIPQYSNYEKFKEAINEANGEQNLIEILDSASKLVMQGSKRIKSLADTPQELKSHLTWSNEELVALSKRAIENSMVAAKIKMKLKSAGEKPAD